MIGKKWTILALLAGAAVLLFGAAAKPAAGLGTTRKAPRVSAQMLITWDPIGRRWIVTDQSRSKVVCYLMIEDASRYSCQQEGAYYIIRHEGAIIARIPVELEDPAGWQPPTVK